MVPPEQNLGSGGPVVNARGDVVFPKSVSSARMRENFALFDFSLNDQDMAAISALDRGEAGRNGPDPATYDHVG